MAALTDSIRVIGSRDYVRIHRRADPRAKWEQVSLDLASAATAAAVSTAAAAPEEGT